MSTNIIKLVTGLAWACVAVSTAVPAEAVAVTTQVGDYASCSNSYTTNPRPWCWDTESHTVIFESTYVQQIKLVSPGCGSGGCSDTGTVYTDQVYSTGRKVATLTTWCDADPANFYQFGDCAC